MGWAAPTLWGALSKLPRSHSASELTLGRPPSVTAVMVKEPLAAPAAYVLSLMLSVCAPWETLMLLVAEPELKVISPLRAAPVLFSEAVNARSSALSAATPEAVSQEGFSVTVQGRLKLEVAFTDLVPPPAPKYRELGVTVMTLLPAAWVTLMLFEAAPGEVIVMEPLRAAPVLLSSAVTHRSSALSKVMEETEIQVGLLATLQTRLKLEDTLTCSDPPLAAKLRELGFTVMMLAPADCVTVRLADAVRFVTVTVPLLDALSVFSVQATLTAVLLTLLAESQPLLAVETVQVSVLAVTPRVLLPALEPVLIEEADREIVGAALAVGIKNCSISAITRDNTVRRLMPMLMVFFILILLLFVLLRRPSLVWACRCTDKTPRRRKRFTVL